jgi:hypothetical protein
VKFRFSPQFDTPFLSDVITRNEKSFLLSRSLETNAEKTVSALFIEVSIDTLGVEFSMAKVKQALTSST